MSDDIEKKVLRFIELGKTYRLLRPNQNRFPAGASSGEAKPNGIKTALKSPNLSGATRRQRVNIMKKVLAKAGDDPYDGNRGGRVQV